MILVDAHCHLERADFADVAALLDRARAAGIVHAIVVGQLQRSGDFGNARELALAHPQMLSATMGIHPHEAARATEERLAELEALCRLPEVIGVGEAGLDYYYDHSPREAQRTAFARQCAIAKAVDKPLIVHVRDAHAECHDLIKEQQMDRGMIHCFTGNTDDARRYLDLGFYISISGIVTYKKTEALQDAVKFTPMARLMVETDSPFLAPLPHRGKKNEPANVVETARKIGELKGLSAEEVGLQAARNTNDLFGLKLSLPEPAAKR